MLHEILIDGEIPKMYALSCISVDFAGSIECAYREIRLYMKEETERKKRGEGCVMSGEKR